MINMARDTQQKKEQQYEKASKTRESAGKQKTRYKQMKS